MKNINNKLEILAKLLRTLSDEKLEKALINRAILDRIYLMRKNKVIENTSLLEYFKFKDLVILETYFLQN